VITIECRCEHFCRYEHLWMITMHVIAGFIAPHTWIPCTECGKVAFWIDERIRGESQLRVVEGGRR
jgi:hypothetical protein